MPFDFQDNTAVPRGVWAPSQHVQRRAREACRRFRTDPSHPSLRFKRVHTIRPFYSARIGLDYRALAVVDGDAVIWFWIGSHAECDQLLRTL